MFKKYFLLAIMLFISTAVVAETMWSVIPGRPKPGGTTRWAWQVEAGLLVGAG